MALSHMQYVVITTTVLIALDHIASHEIYRDAVSNGVWADTMWLNFTNSWNTTTLQESIAATKAGLNPIETWLNEATIHHSKPYYLGSFPRTMFTYALCVPLQQYWNIYLERLLPTRSRRRDVSYQEKQAGGPVGEDGAGREEEIVNRWIAQGKVRRSSFNKCNTFLKWILDITVGKVLYEVVYHTIEGMLERELTWNHLMEEGVKCLGLSFLSIGPLVSLIGFIVIPAQERVVFRAGIDLFESIFISAFWRTVAPWVIRTDFMQDGMRNITEENWLRAEQAVFEGVHRIDEL